MSEQRETLLEVNGLTVHYGDLCAIKDVSLKIHRGDMVSLIGANGAGKSTLLTAIMGLNKPTAGTVVWKGQDITGLPTNKIVSEGLVLTPEGSHVFADMTVRENLQLGAYPARAKKNRAQNLELVYETFPVLKEKDKQLASFLSGGQRQMLAIARAIMSEPDLIICDEISLGLAPVIIKDIYHSLSNISAKGVSFLLVEQEIKRCLKHTKYAYVMVKGSLVMEGRCDELNEDAIRDAYFGINDYA